MKFLQRIGNAFCTRIGAYIFFALAAAAFIFWRSSSWAHWWIAAYYPLGANFIPMLSWVIGICAAVMLGALFAATLIEPEKIWGNRVFRPIYLAFTVLSGALFVYTAALMLGLDNGFGHMSHGLRHLSPYLPLLAVIILLPLSLFICSAPKKAAKAVLALAVSGAIVASMWFSLFGPPRVARCDASRLPPITLQSQNVLEGATVVWESLRADHTTPSAQNLLEDNCAYWVAWYPNRNPAPGHPDVGNSLVELQLAQESTFNLAVIEELGNQAQYFRLQAYVDGEWFTFYQSEKIQALRLCSFDAVTTDRVRLSIDRFRYADVAVHIRSLRLYNEPAREAGDFRVVAYQRLDARGDIPTEILAQGYEFVRNYARFFDVYNTIIVFDKVHWDENGNICFGELGEEGFARELAALREIIAHRSNLEREVDIIVTTLADGLGGDGHHGVNRFMHQHWESVADQTIEFVQRHNLQGVDIDWEYPQTFRDWRLYDRFIERLHDGLLEHNPDIILSGALAAGALGMSTEVLRRFDQIQFMAYDGRDIDGFHCSLQQAQEGLQAFIDNGADISRINIGIGAYARPINSLPLWVVWRGFAAANYWNSRYYNILYSDQIFIGTFCAPAQAGDKTAYALFSGAGGVMVFRLCIDKLMDEPYSVARGIENALHRIFVDW